MLNKEYAKEMRGDYIPGGERVEDVNSLKFRKTGEMRYSDVVGR